LNQEQFLHQGISLCSSVSLCLRGDQSSSSPQRHRDTELHREESLLADTSGMSKPKRNDPRINTRLRK